MTTQKGTSGKSRSPGGGRRAATKQVKSSHRYGRFLDVPIPKIKNGDKGSPSLLAMAFGIKERGE